MTDGVDQFIGELLGGQVANFKGRVFPLGFMGDGLQQMGFAQTHGAVNKKRIVRFGRIFCHGLGRGKSKTVACPHHKIFKKKTRI